MSIENKTLKDASEELKLCYEEQDWGIINSDPNRIKEFINYFEKHKNSKSNSFKYDMFELIVASYNDAILEDKINNIIENDFRDLINEHKNEELYQTIFSYWIEIKNNEEFPVGNYLEKLFN